MISTQRILTSLQTSCLQISKIIRNTNSLELSSNTTQQNSSEETVKTLDEQANTILKQSLQELPEIRTIASEEETTLLTVNPSGHYLVSFDPLDGSSNIGVNITIGTIFAIYQYSSHDESLTMGTQIVMAGYCLYGGSTQMIVATREEGVSILQLQEGEFHPIKTNYLMPNQGNIVSHNYSNTLTYTAPRIAFWLEELIENRKYSFRYVGSLVADAHRTLLTGGVFLYPANQTHSQGKIRLLYEAFPMAFIFECAGGIVTNGDINILYLPFPEDPHQRTPIYMSSLQEYTYFSSI